MRGLDIHKNIPVSITKLTIGLRVGFISSHLIADKLFPINPRAIMGPPKMSLLLEVKIMPGLKICLIVSNLCVVCVYIYIYICVITESTGTFLGAVAVDHSGEKSNPILVGNLFYTVIWHGYLIYKKNIKIGLNSYH